MLTCQFCDFQQNPDDANFCGRCGANLIPPDEGISKRLALFGGELRRVSVFFVNLKVLEKLLRNDQYEAAMLYIQDFMEEIISIIEESDGTAIKIIPDLRILAIFGAPRAHPDDPFRAIRCIDKINRWWQDKKKTISFFKNSSISIGLNSGQAFFGYVLKNTPFLTIIGDTINVAARLTEIGPPGIILLTKNSYEILSDWIEAAYIGTQVVKGKTKKIDLYRFKTLKPKKEISQEIPLFGRQQELKQLTSIAQSIQKNRIAVSIITGQMGIGKTRLKEEFETYLSYSQNIQFYETHCSVEIHTPFYPFKILLKSYLKLKEFDPQPIITKKIDDAVRQRNLPAVTSKGLKHLFLTDLRRLRQDEIQTISEDIYTAIKNIIHYECQKKPLVLIFEEFNKADTMTKLLITYIVSECENEPLMLLFINVSRDFLGSISVPVQEINIPPLAKKDIKQLIKFFLGDVDDSLVEFLYRAAGGNPLLTIEAIRNTQRTKIIRKTSGRWFLEKEHKLSFLDDLYGVVMSTIDSLPVDYRLIIDYASVIGYSFNFRILQELMQRKNLKKQLNHLIKEGYFILSSIESEPVYIFRHNLLKDTAYTVLPLKKRHEIHRKIAGLFEKLFKENLSFYYEDIGHHYFSCDNFKKASYYFKLAGDKAKNLYALEQALNFYNKIIDIDKKTPLSSDVIKDVFLNLSDIYELNGNIDRMEKIARNGLQMARRENNTRDEVLFSERTATALILKNMFEEAEELLLLAIQKSTEDIADLLTILYADLGALYTGRYEYEKSVLNYNLSWNTARAHNIKVGEIICLYNLANLHRTLGNYEQAFAYLDYGLEITRDLDILKKELEFNYLISQLYTAIGDKKEARKILTDCLKKAREIGNFDVTIKSSLDLAQLSAEENLHNETDQYLTFIDKKIPIIMRENILSEINLKKAFIYFYKNDFQKAKNFVANARKSARQFRQKEIEFYSLYLLSYLDNKESLLYAKKALTLAEGIKLPPLIARAQYRLTEIFIQEEDLERARHYGKRALFLYNIIKSQLKEEHQKVFSQRPEYQRLLQL